MQLSLGMYILSPLEGASLVYEAGRLEDVSVPLGKKAIVVPISFVELDDLESIFPGEKYAGTMGGMFFASSNLPREYHHFAAFHEMAEHAAPRGLDITGRAAHYQAIALELGYAKATLSATYFEKYYEWRRSVETSKFFRFKDSDGLIDSLALRMDNIFGEVHKFATFRGKHLARLADNAGVTSSE